MPNGFRALPPFSVAMLIDDPSLAPPTVDPPVDRLGQLQLWILWDGTNLHKSVRTWDGTAWTTRVDAEAEPLTIQIGDTGAAFWFPDVHPGENMAGLIAMPNVCEAVAIGPNGRPDSRLTGVG